MVSGQPHSQSHMLFRLLRCHPALPTLSPLSTWLTKAFLFTTRAHEQEQRQAWASSGHTVRDLPERLSWGCDSTAGTQGKEGTLRDNG